MVNFYFTEIPVIFANYKIISTELLKKYYKMEEPKSYSMSELMENTPEHLWGPLLELAYPDLIRFCAVSKAAKKICDTDTFWERKTRRDFGVEYDYPPSSRSWKEDYLYHLQSYGQELIQAAEKGNKERVEELLEFGINPNVRDEERYTALMMASSKGQVEIVKMLLESGGDPNLQNKWSEEAIGFAIRYPPHREIVEILLNAGVDPNISYNDVNVGTVTPLIHATINDDEEIPEILLKNDADVNIKNVDGLTALMVASQNDYSHMVEFLLNNGADPDLQDTWEETALMRTEETEAVESARLLLEGGADLTIENNKGETALDLASGSDIEDIIREYM